jgi:hypothetical protein
VRRYPCPPAGSIHPIMPADIVFTGRGMVTGLARGKVPGEYGCGFLGQFLADHLDGNVVKLRPLRFFRPISRRLRLYSAKSSLVT